ncbi:VacJ family lipoprotein [Pseudoduganella umbonata]|nr:VacJ family lipoprotein [Pseudoduganella umbonata]
MTRAAHVLLVAAMASGCATANPAAQSAADPWEGFNRRMFNFNERVDAAVLEPAASAWVRVVPEPARIGVANVLSNIRDLWSGVNHFLQGKGRDGLATGARVLVNTSVGVLGLRDPATGMGLPRRPEDFGQTLGRWGVAPGPYLVVPLVGPSTLRDGVALPLDSALAPARLASGDAGVAALTAVEAVSQRAGLLQASDLLDEIALDKYILLRDAWLARRRDSVHDGAVPADAAGIGGQQ